MNYTTTSVSNTFNARHKTPLEVARDFIPPPQFSELMGSNNSLLVGPRGSGKTTLLKMLQVSALLSWVDAETASSKILPFVGVFVAADVRWAKQLEIVTSKLKDANIRRLIHEASFVNFVNLALVESLEKSIKLDVLGKVGSIDGRLERSSEAELARKLADIWKTESAPSFSSLKHALRVQQAEVPRICAEIEASDQPQIVLHRYLFLNRSWLSLFSFAIETINEHLEIEGQKWALLVDELEIIPPDLLELILIPLRSVSGNILFKYAISPNGVQTDVLSNRTGSNPTHGNDFAILQLSNARKEDTRNFSTRLLARALEQKNLIPIGGELVRYLGQSGTTEDDTVFDGDVELDTGRVSLQQRKKMFSELANKDESFRSFLAGKKIEVESLSTSDKSASGTLVRKITPLVYLRNHILKSWTTGEKGKRSKYGTQPFQRFPNILDLTEGNPRWILNLADDLAIFSGTKGSKILAQGVQSSAIGAFTDRFVSMLRVYPVGDGAPTDRVTPFDLLDKLGGYLNDKLFSNEFSPDPPLSFSIDSRSAEQYGDLISICIHLGALIFVDSGSSKASTITAGASELVDREVRICNRLAPKYFLPLRAGRAIKMATALGGTSFSITSEKVSKVKSAEVATKEMLSPSLAVLDKTSQLKLF